MSAANEKFAANILSSILSVFPSKEQKNNINYTLGYFQAVFKLVDMTLLKSVHACILIADTISYKCVQINDEVLAFIKCAKTLASTSGEDEAVDLYKFQFLRIWLEDISAMYSPIQWPKDE